MRTRSKSWKAKGEVFREFLESNGEISYKAIAGEEPSNERREIP